jgi:hypothetical protein
MAWHAEAHMPSATLRVVPACHRTAIFLSVIETDAAGYCLARRKRSSAGALQCGDSSPL